MVSLLQRFADCSLENGRLYVAFTKEEKTIFPVNKVSGKKH